MVGKVLKLFFMAQKSCILTEVCTLFISTVCVCLCVCVCRCLYTYALVLQDMQFTLKF